MTDDHNGREQTFRDTERNLRNTIETQAREIERLQKALVNLQPALVRDLGPGYAGVALIQAALGESHD